MPIEKPEFKHTPEPINSERFGVPPYFRYYCEYHNEPFPDEESYNAHMVKFHPGVAKAPFGDFNPFNEKNVRDTYPEDERARIDNVLGRLDDIQNELDSIGDALEDEIRKINIAYDPNKYPLLDEAVKCPYCIDGGESHVLTGTAFGNADASRNRVYMNNLPDTSPDRDPTDILADQERFMQKQIEGMTKAVFNQILIWILEFIYKIFRPLRKVPFAKAIPNTIKKWINRLKKQYKYNSVYDDLEGVDDITEPKITWKSITGGNNVDESARCIIHYNNFDATAYVIAEEDDPRNIVMLNMKKTNDAVKDNTRVLKEDVAGMKIKDNYEYDGKVYSNRNRTYGGKLSDVEPQENKNKAFEIVLNETEKYIHKMRKILNSWTNSEEMICCFIYNLTTLIPPTRGGKDLETVIDQIKILNGILKFTRNIQINDYKHNAAKLINLISNIVNDLIRNIISQYVYLLTGYFRDGINTWLDRVYKIKKDHFDRPLKICIPFDTLARLLPEWFKDISLRLNRYLSSLWGDLVKVPERSTMSAELAVEILELDAMIKFLEKVQKYLRFWMECSTDEGYTTYVPDVSIDSDTPTGILQNAKKSSTLYNKQGFTEQKSLDSMESEELEDFYNNMRSNLEADKSSPWSYTGMKVLLTNFLGIDESRVDAIISESEKGDCVCKNGFNPSEIDQIKGMI